MLGIHVSKGKKTYEKAIEDTYKWVKDDYKLELGACQIFANVPRNAFKETKIDSLHNLSPKNFYSHSSYNALMNGTVSSTNGIILELKRCAQLNIRGLVVHLYSISKEAIVNMLQNIFEKEKTQEANKTTALLLEHVVSRNKNFLYSDPIDIIELMEYIKLKLPHANIGFCIDTCHIWANRIDISTAELATKYVNGIKPLVGKFPLLAHLNDCDLPLGDARDRHAPIGTNIWKKNTNYEGLKVFLTFFKQNNIDFILERDASRVAEDLAILSQIL